MKTCPKCNTSKPFAEYYMRGDRPSSYCRACTKSYQANWCKGNYERKLEINRDWVKRNTERKKMMNYASNTLQAALKRGLLKRPDQCSACSGVGAIEAAHHDYSQPLNVRWLCRACHREWDALLPKTL